MSLGINPMEFQDIRYFPYSPKILIGHQLERASDPPYQSYMELHKVLEFRTNISQMGFVVEKYQENVRNRSFWDIVPPFARLVTECIAFTRCRSGVLHKKNPAKPLTWWGYPTETDPLRRSPPVARAAGACSTPRNLLDGTG